jgi:L-aspartate oxidase
VAVVAVARLGSGRDLCRRREPRSASLRTPLSQSRQLLGSGAGGGARAGDSPARHAADAISAGRGCCRPAAVEALVEEAPGRRELERGVEFDLDPDEGWLWGSRVDTRRRIVHSGGSQTGSHEITSKLAAMVLGEPRIGCEIPRSSPSERTGPAVTGFTTDPEPVAARATVLATGGGRALAADDQPARERSAPAR